MRLGTTAAGATATAASSGRAAFALLDPMANANPLAPPPCQMPDRSGFPSAVRGTGGLGGNGFAASCAPRRPRITSDANSIQLRIASVYRIHSAMRRRDCLLSQWFVTYFVVGRTPSSAPDPRSLRPLVRLFQHTQREGRRGRRPRSGGPPHFAQIFNKLGGQETS